MNPLEQYAWRPVTTATTDAELVTTIQAINLCCRMADRVREDRTELRARLDRLCPELLRRIRGKHDAQDASALIEALYALIYQRSFSEADRGPRQWRVALLEHTHRLLLAYRRDARLDFLTLFTHLRVYASLCRDLQIERHVHRELKTRIDRALERLTAPQAEPLTVSERITLALPRLLSQGEPYIDGPRDAQWSRVYAALVSEVRPPDLPNAALLRWIRLLSNLPVWYLDVPARCEERLQQALQELEKRKGEEVIIEQLKRKRTEKVSL